MSQANAPLEEAVLVSTTAPYVQIEPQHMWHGEAYIRANYSGLKALAAALLKAADSDAATTDTLFASDGEGYKIEILRMERPLDYPQPFYTVQVESRDYGGANGKMHCGKCGRVKP